MPLGTRSPDVLQPFNGLDQENRAALVSTLAALKAEGVAVLVSTHDLDLAQQVCDRVLLLEHGRVAVGELPPAPPRNP